MRDFAPEVLAIADACLGGLQGHSALLIGPEENRQRYAELLQQARMKYVYEENTAERLPYLLPYVQLLISVPPLETEEAAEPPRLTAASIAKGSTGRRAPLFIFDLAPCTSVEELAGLLPSVSLYTSRDLRKMLGKEEKKAS
jgi:glutamyl-tRNA reductase